MKEPVELLDGVLTHLESPHSGVARGHAGGHVVEVRMVDRGHGSTHVPFTEVWVRPAPPDTIFLHVIPERRVDKDDVERGLGTDLELGDAAFDAMFLVEAAPADVVAHLFDGSLRDAMRALHPVGVHTREPSAKHPGGLLVEKPSWVKEPEAMRALTELALRVTRRIPRAFEHAQEVRRAKQGYRGDAPSHDPRAEIAAVRAGLTERRKTQSARSCGIAAAVIVLGILLSALTMLLSESCSV